MILPPTLLPRANGTPTLLQLAVLWPRTQTSIPPSKSSRATPPRLRLSTSQPSHSPSTLGPTTQTLPLQRPSPLSPPAPPSPALLTTVSTRSRDAVPEADTADTVTVTAKDVDVAAVAVAASEVRDAAVAVVDSVAMDTAVDLVADPVLQMPLLHLPSHKATLN